MTIFRINNCLAKQTRSISKWIQPSELAPKFKDTGIMIYNPIEKSKVPLIVNNPATWYSCGPTVYDSAHIGHASCYLKLDILQRILTDYFDINIITSMGITDIDDKIINRSKSSGIPCEEITRKYETEFWKNMVDLNIRMPHIILRVTDHILAIKEFIEKIETQNLCYKAEDNSVFFDTKAYGKYGKFKNEETSVVHDSHLKFKKNNSDFALWKSHKEGESFWESKWGKGRPGWHIECSAMVSRAFGAEVDFHTGGIDLKFPHHENEEAQSCAYHGRDQWINYWIHTGHLHLRDDVKMSKSLKNTLSIDEILKKHNASVFRMACLCSHYRYNMEYNEEIMENAGNNLNKIKVFLEDCTMFLNKDISMEDETIMWKLLHETTDEVDKALRDDFDTAKCIMQIMRLIGEVNKIFHKNKNRTTESKQCSNKVSSIISISNYILKIFKHFGLPLEKTTSTSDNKLTTDIVDLLINFRSSVRKNSIQNRNKELLKECDNIRDHLKQHKISIRDTADSSVWNFEEK